MPAVSIIIPVYNVEKYLRRCLESVINQSFYNIEIIILNDGSTDNSLEICNEYKERDKRVAVYSHENMGLGQTRNRGITLAAGEYVAFVDSDDFIEPNGISEMYSTAMASSADIIQGQLLLFPDGKEDEARIRQSFVEVENIKLNRASLERFFKEYYFTRIYSHNACDKLFKRDFLIKNNILFGDNKKIFSEDNWLQLQALRCCPSIAFCDQRYYWYRQQANSIMHAPKNNLVKRHGKMISDYCELITDSTDGLLERKVCSIIASEIFTMSALNNKVVHGDRNSFVTGLKEILDQDDLKNAICDLYKIRGAELFSCNKGRMLYLFIIGWLYSHGMYASAHKLVWILYRNR